MTLVVIPVSQNNTTSNTYNLFRMSWNRFKLLVNLIRLSDMIKNVI